MSILDRITGEFIDVIEWDGGEANLMVWKYPRYDNAIKYGAQLTVKEGQKAVFVNEGRVADVFDPGRYTLDTNNLPILTTLQAWPLSFSSPFKAEVYFFSTRQFTALKWGTRNPLLLRDPEFGPLRLRAFGTYAIKITNPVQFLREVTGTDSHFKTERISDQLRNIIVSRFSSVLAESKIPVLDLASNYDDLSTFLENHLKSELTEYGIGLTKFLVENISLPASVETALDKRTSLGIVGDLSRYTQFQTAEAMTKAAENTAGGGVAAMGIGLGMAQVLSQSMNTASQTLSRGTATPPPLPKHDTLKIYVALGGAQSGPYNAAEVKELWLQKQMDEETLVWMASMQDWQEARSQPLIMSLIAEDTPPKLPS